ncbi:MAG: DUF4124 domain-containing protein [Deltaproteobacteria bacterium]|nr:DUF4124 domain-containing protein [Deltaproteobacteria bacterium]
MKMLGAAVLVVVLCASTVHAEFYSWTDKDGKPHIAAKMEEVPQEYKEKVKVRQSLYKNDAVESPVSAGDNGSSGGKLYYWKDEFGRTHIVNSIEQVPAQYRGSVETRSPLAPENKSKAPEPSKVKETGQPEGDVIYSWTDNDGSVHITDSMEKVPAKYRSKVKIRKATESRPSNVAEPSGDGAQPQPETELYGDHPLDWWKEAFRKLKNDIGGLESSIIAKRNFVKLVETGMRVGQLYESKDVETYEQYRKELPDDEARLDSLKAEQEELRRKARIVGVPKTLWGE